jgi:hypothetical protein
MSMSRTVRRRAASAVLAGLVAAAFLLVAAYGDTEIRTAVPTVDVPGGIPAQCRDAGDHKDDCIAAYSAALRKVEASGRDVPAECHGEIDFIDVCVTVAERGAYAWTDPDGTPHTVPDGRTLLRRIKAEPGSEEFIAALFALDAAYVAHNQ